MSFRELIGIELLDGAGRVLYSEGGDDDGDFIETGPPTYTPRRLAGRRGAPSLWQTTIRYGDETSRCLALTAGPRPSKDEACEVARSDETVLLDASCATHRLTVAVTARAGVRVLAQTGTRTTRRLRLRDGAGLLTLAPGTRLRALVFMHKGRRTRVRLDAPPGAKQCGWHASPPIDVG